MADNNGLEFLDLTSRMLQGVLCGDLNGYPTWFSAMSTKTTIK